MKQVWTEDVRFKATMVREGAEKAFHAMVLYSQDNEITTTKDISEEDFSVNSLQLTMERKSPALEET